MCIVALIGSTWRKNRDRTIFIRNRQYTVAVLADWCAEIHPEKAVLPTFRDCQKTIDGVVPARDDYFSALAELYYAGACLFLDAVDTTALSADRDEDSEDSEPSEDGMGYDEEGTDQNGFTEPDGMKTQFGLGQEGEDENAEDEDALDSILAESWTEGWDKQVELESHMEAFRAMSLAGQDDERMVLVVKLHQDFVGSLFFYARTAGMISPEMVHRLEHPWMQLWCTWVLNNRELPAQQRYKVVISVYEKLLFNALRILATPYCREPERSASEKAEALDRIFPFFEDTRTISSGRFLRHMAQSSEIIASMSAVLDEAIHRRFAMSVPCFL